jgi:hypothetical protein
MIEPEMLQQAIWPTFIIVLVASAAIYAQAFVRLVFGFFFVVDRKNGITISWLQLGWMIFLWAFLFASYWPVVAILVEPDWTFGEFLYTTAGAILIFLAAYAISPDATYLKSDGEQRYRGAAPLFFGFFAAVQIWLVYYANVISDAPMALGVLGVVSIAFTIALAVVKNQKFQQVVSIVIWIGATVLVVLQAADVIDGALRTGETAPIQGGVITIWLASFVISIMLLVMITLGQYVNRESGFRPYFIHAAWVVWLFVSLLLVWWRSPILVTEGWDYHHFLFFSLAPLAVAIAWLFFMPTPTEGSTDDARTQYYDKAPQAFGAMAFVAAWAIVMNLWLINGDTATTAMIGWTILLVLFIAMTRSRNPWLHGSAATFAWIVLLSELAFELDRGVPAL